MERLTTRDAEGTRFITPKGEIRSASEFSVNNVRILLDRLADYEEAEEQGFLARLPSKVGNTVFYNFLNKTYEGKLNKVVYHGAGTHVYFSDCDGDNTSLPITKVYSSREEAEAALAKEC